MIPSFEADRAHVGHMLECIRRVTDYTREGRATFMQSSMVQDAVVRNLQSLTESGLRLSDEAKRSVPSAPWRALSGFRNVLVHGYLGLDLEIVWRVIERDLPALRDALISMTVVLRLGQADERPR